MNYNEIVNLITGYSNRNDADTLGRIPEFIVLAEARMNRDLRTFDMTTRTLIQADLDPTVLLYDLDVSAKGIREVEHVLEGGSKRTLRYINAERMNAYSMPSNSGGLVGDPAYYTTINGQIQTAPNFVAPTYLEISAYMQVDPLATEDTNWVSDDHPDLYLYGGMAELAGYIKNQGAKDYWLTLMSGIYEEIQTVSEFDEWVGAPMQVRSDTRIGQSSLNQGRGGQ
jgi:hypothetical protein